MNKQTQSSDSTIDRQTEYAIFIAIVWNQYEYIMKYINKMKMRMEKKQVCFRKLTSI